MMHWRKDGGGIGRYFSAYVALALMIALVSPGITVHAEETVPPGVPVTGDVIVPAPEAPIVVPVPDAPVADPAAEVTASSSGPTPPAPSAVVKQRKSISTAAPVARTAVPTVPSLVSVLPYAPVGEVSLEGWTLAPHAKWTAGDVKGYFEGDWIPFRLTIDNSKGNAVDVQVPSMVYKVDHINGGAVAMDSTASWRWQIGSGPVTAYTPTVQDSTSNPMYLTTQLPEVAGFVIPAGQIGYIYFEGHLALTPYWITQDPSYLGASGYPGSSAQARLVEWNGVGIGDKTVPFPVGKQTAPTGVLSGLKFEDLNGDGNKDAGENPLSGWVFHLEYLDPDFPFTLTATSAADGTFSFTDLPSGNYMLSEVSQSPYVLTTDLSDSIAVVNGQTTGPIEVGNRRPDVKKTFALTIDGDMPAADSYFVRYVVDSASHDLSLVLDGGVYGADAVLPYDTTIASWQFFAMMGTEEVALSAVLGPETLTGPMTNPFTYVPGEISGHKYIDANGDNEADGPGEGWLIKLFRDGEFYAQATTAADGSYSFDGLLPGSYTLEEAEQSDYIKIAPSGPFLGPFAIVSGAIVTGVDFLNQEKPIGITTTKSVDPTLAHVGDMLTYTIDVENTGEVSVLLTSVTDPMFMGGANLLTASVALLPGQSLSDLGMAIVLQIPAPDADSVDNTALAQGTTVFGPVSDSDSAHVDILSPAIDVTKSVDPTMVTDSGDVTYHVTVTNTGNTTLTVDVVDYVDDAVHKTLDTGLVLAPQAHKDYEWVESVSSPTHDTVVASGIDVLGGEVSDEASADVGAEVTKTFALTIDGDMPAADSYFVRYVVDSASHDLSLVLDGGVYGADVVLPYDTTIASWQFFAMMGTEEVALSAVLGPETLTGPMTNPFTYVPGEISGHKYRDLDNNGVWNEGEPALQGWTIQLFKSEPIVVGISAAVIPAAWTLVDEMVTGSDGSYHFGGLAPGVYRVQEVQQPGWSMTASPSDIPVSSETVVTDADFGNHQIIYNKTFELTYAGAPEGTTFSAAFAVNGEPMDVALDGTGPFTATLPVVYPWEIGPVTWYAHLGSETFVLGETAGETLEGDVTNSFTYTASMSGFKFSDDDGNGIWNAPGEVGLPGWTIGLYRQSGDQVAPSALPAPEAGYVLAASTVTGADGSYMFSGLLPGTYYVAEDQQSGWTMTVGPGGPFQVGNGTALVNLNFGNQEPFLPFTDTDLTKSADKTTASPGDIVTYTLTYKNIGDGTIDSITIVDDYDQRYMTPVNVSGATVAGGTLTWVDNVPLAAGQQRSITYTMRVSANMPVGLTHVDNVAVITPGGHQANWRVNVTVDEPFLPFTGGDALVLLLIAAGAALVGVMFSRRARAS
ncbi:MAG: DUF11 domain-containing protein [Actinomycetia bacterium]|nr:DUF11 domain-containing protein [Actinomycetes bacterium]